MEIIAEINKLKNNKGAGENRILAKVRKCGRQGHKQSPKPH